MIVIRDEAAAVDTLPAGAITMQQSLLDALNEKFNIGPRFANRLLETYQEAQKLDFTGARTFDELMALCQPIHKMHLDFAFTTNQRGMNTIEMLRPLFQRHHRRFLDVGCGQGGFVVSAAQSGFETQGLELVPHLAELSRLNCQDQGIDVNAVIHEDFLKIKLDTLGQFDIITCNDVIEHVHHPEMALRRLAVLLKPGGVLYMEIPNKDCISFVEADGHFKLFGINQLDHAAAEKLFNTMMPEAGGYTGMGEFYPLGYYLTRLQNDGLDVNVVQNQHMSGTIDDVPRQLSALAAAYAAWYQNDRPKLDYFVGENMIRNYHTYVSQLMLDYNKARYDGAVEAFESRYLNSFWTLIATKSQG